MNRFQSWPFGRGIADHCGDPSSYLDKDLIGGEQQALKPQAKRGNQSGLRLGITRRQAAELIVLDRPIR